MDTVSLLNGHDSKMTWAFVPPNPNEDTPAYNGDLLSSPPILIGLLDIIALNPSKLIFGFNVWK
jgi:hypothetical protein